MQAKNDIIEIETRDFSPDNRRKFNLKLALFDSTEMHKKSLRSETFEYFRLIEEKL